MTWYLRLMVTIVVALGAGVMVALALTFVDLHLTGHARPSIKLETVVVPGTSLRMSVADLLLLSGIALSGLVTWFALQRILATPPAADE